MVIVYRGKWRWIPVHNVYWSNGNFRTATCIMTIIDSRTDKNYTACFCSKLTPIHTKWHTQLSTKLRKPSFFDLQGLLITFICSFSLSVLYWVMQFPFFSISSSINWIKFFTLLPLSTTLTYYEMICETNLMQHLWFYNN